MRINPEKKLENGWTYKYIYIRILFLIFFSHYCNDSDPDLNMVPVYEGELRAYGLYHTRADKTAPVTNRVLIFTTEYNGVIYTKATNAIQVTGMKFKF